MSYVHIHLIYKSTVKKNKGGKKMKKGKRMLAFLLVISLTAMLFSGCGAGGNNEEASNGEDLSENYTWKLAHEEAPGSDMDIYCQELKKVLSEKSDGQIELEVYAYGQLGDGADQVELIQDGMVEFGTVGIGPSGVIIPESNIFTLLYFLPNDPEDLQSFLHNANGMDIMEELYYEKELKVLDWATSGPSYWTADKPLRKPDDFKGFKMRAPASPLVTKGYQAFGANPTPTPFAEVYSGLQLNMIDGQANPGPCIRDMKFYEVQDYIIDSGSDSFLFPICANVPFWESLSDDIKNMIEDAVSEVNVTYNEYMIPSRQVVMDEIVESDTELITLTEEEQEEFKKLSLPVREEYVKIAGGKAQEILDLFTGAIENEEYKK